MSYELNKEKLDLKNEELVKHCVEQLLEKLPVEDVQQCYMCCIVIGNDTQYIASAGNSILGIAKELHLQQLSILDEIEEKHAYREALQQGATNIIDPNKL